MIIAQGILEFKQSKKSHLVDTDVQAFLDRFYMSRIGIRMLIGMVTLSYLEQSRVISDPTADFFSLHHSRRSTHCIKQGTITQGLCGNYLHKDQFGGYGAGGD
jgi:hypothetical protein